MMFRFAPAAVLPKGIAASWATAAAGRVVGPVSLPPRSAAAASGDDVSPPPRDLARGLFLEIVGSNSGFGGVLGRRNDGLGCQECPRTVRVEQASDLRFWQSLSVDSPAPARQTPGSRDLVSARIADGVVAIVNETRTDARMTAGQHAQTMIWAQHLGLLLLLSALVTGSAQGPLAVPGPEGGAPGPNYYSGDVTLQKIQLDTSAYPEAVCNGTWGSQPAYATAQRCFGALRRRPSSHTCGSLLSLKAQ